MNRDDFLTQYYEITSKAIDYAERARREGLLALEDELDEDKVNSRDILEYGIRFVVDGTDANLIYHILTNIIAQEKDEQIILLKNIQREAVMQIQTGINPRMLYYVLNSHVDLALNEDKFIKS